MSTQTTNGRAFEWAVGYVLNQKTNFPIVENINSELNAAAFSSFDFSEKKKTEFINAATVAVDHILNKEAKFIGSNKVGSISFNSDSAGQDGDVRDVLITVGDKTIGISCKNNHNALKHPRLSGIANFIKEWGIDKDGCSDVYWRKVKPIFDELSQIRNESNRLARWKDIDDKAIRFYWPVLDAWAEELKRVCDIDKNHEIELCRTIISFIIGKYDFYKIIRRGKKRVVVQGFNLSKTLATKQTKYPTCINAINKKNGGQYSKTIIFNHGYSINFRIHSAETLVAPSLKFDVKAIGLPVDEIYQQTFDL